VHSQPPPPCELPSFPPVHSPDQQKHACTGPGPHLPASPAHRRRSPTRESRPSTSPRTARGATRHG
jgi:hypothetical protein